MKKFTRFFATVAAVSMVAASLAGCGSKSDNAAGTEAASDSASAAPSCRIPCGSGARSGPRRTGKRCFCPAEGLRR